MHQTFAALLFITVKRKGGSNLVPIAIAVLIYSLEKHCVLHSTPSKNPMMMMMMTMTSFGFEALDSILQMLSRSIRRKLSHNLCPRILAAVVLVV
jgi:hypothetical protein